MNLEVFSYFQQYFDKNATVKVIFSAAHAEYKKIIVKPVEIKGEVKWQVERHLSDKVFHTNLSLSQLLSEIKQNIINNYKQINIVNKNSAIQILVSKKGKVTVRVSQTQERSQDLGHNKSKSYIFSEGEDIAPLRDLGVFSQDNRIIKAKFDKFKQINRFIEIVNDEFKAFDQEQITIMDFGCGKSYLTFLVYYYFKYIKKIKIRVLGYDLKQDVVDECNKIAKKYGYSDLCFFRADIAAQDKIDYKVDMIITLHACDIATDYALYNAINNNVKYIFSVPCCQHEINSQIKSSGELKLLLGDGLIKERFSSLLTDAIRCEILRQEGYMVDVIEFVDFSHSPKNLMIRATLNKNKKRSFESVKALLKQFGCKQKLFELVGGKED
ncbi:MAG: SAM-dependent methyltransferase [Christensenellaceae bacterium]|nr:SAM-dependent methyltransferase [Christensenellaceae bacterium]